MTLTPTIRTHREQEAAERFAEVTERSISDARLAQLTERRDLEARFGIRFDPFRDGALLRDRRTPKTKTKTFARGDRERLFDLSRTATTERR